MQKRRQLHWVNTTPLLHFERQTRLFAGSAIGLANSATPSPAMCLIDPKNGNRSVYEVLLRIGLPLILIAITLCYFALSSIYKKSSEESSCCKRKLCVTVRFRLLVCWLVAFTITFQSFSEEFVGLFGCIELDSKELSKIDARHANFSIATGKHWTQDTSVECFKGMHGHVARTVGIVGIVLFVMVFPLSLGGFLYFKSRGDKPRTGMGFRILGFIHQNYKDSRVYWEFVILARKAFIVVIVVFAYPLGTHLQASLTLAVLTLALVVHLLARPFRTAFLNALETYWLFVSVSALFVGLVFHDDRTSSVIFTILSVFLVFLYASFALVAVTFFLCYLYIHVDAEKKLDQEKKESEKSFSPLKLLSRAVHARFLDPVVQRSTRVAQLVESLRKQRARP